MSSIEGLKEQARRHEQREEWGKALDLYSKAIAQLDEEEQPDIGLFNRVGDICTRTGDSVRAVEHYEKAVDLYLEAELPNNAIAVCKKIIRNLPNRHAVYLRMGQIRADQGFLVDARNSFLTYAEKVQSTGNIDEALRALGEFADLAPADTDIRMALADQYVQHERPEEAVGQLAAAHAVLVEKGDMEAASAVEARALEIDPGADLSAYAQPVTEDPEATAELGFESTALAGEDFADDSGISAEFGEIVVDETAHDEPGEEDTEPDEATDEEAALEVVVADISSDDDAAEVSDLEVVSDFGDLEVSVPMEASEEDSGADHLDKTEGDEEDEDLGGELPLIAFDDVEKAEEAEDEAASEAMSDLAEVLTSTDEELSLDDDEREESFEEEDDVAELPLLLASDDEADEQDEEDEEDDEVADLPLLIDEAEEEGALEADDVELASDSSPDEVPGEEEDEAEAEAPEPVEKEAATESPREAFDRLTAEAQSDPENVSIPQTMVEVAFQTGDDALMATAYLTLAETLNRTGEGARAKAVFQQVLTVDPANQTARAALDAAGGGTREVKEVAASEEYVDLGSLILGDDEEKTTRFVVAYEEPSGDEAADFRKMLSQFKEKVAENFDASDVQAHHDLGTAYKEMGLLDEAIEEFQQALRASSDHLPTYELLGQVFMERGDHVAAVRVLSRALEANYEVEDEFLGIYYYLGRAHQELGQRSEAVDYYDRVFALDINFADVTERLRTLR